MNYTEKDWYNELYRIFSCADSLITQTQAIKIGDCMRALLAGENIVYKLEDLYQSFKTNQKISVPLENYIHRYIDNIKNDSIEQSQPRIQEVDEYGTLHTEADSTNPNS